MIRKITPTGVVSTIAGTWSQGSTDGIGTAAQFYTPRAIAIAPSGNLYVSDTGNNRIRKITPSGDVSTVAGSSNGYLDGTGTAAKFSGPLGIVSDSSGNLYVADTNNHKIRIITSAGVVSTLAGSVAGYFDHGTGTVAQFNSPIGVALDSSGNVYGMTQLRVSLGQL